MPKNTILNYFQRRTAERSSQASPSIPQSERPQKSTPSKKIAGGDGDAGKKSGTPKSEKRKKSDNYEEEDELPSTPKSEKKPRLQLDSFRSPTPSALKRTASDQGDSSLLDATSPCRSPSTPSSPSTPRASLMNDGGFDFPHLSYPFLQESKIADKNKRRPDHPDYDCTTLYVPSSFLDSQTPAQRQWWNLKSENFDTILFFKMGQFYELFHMDAVIAVKECGLIFMKKDYAHCGFPEVSFQRYSDVLVDKGFKVARIEQVETPKMMEQRCKEMFKPTKFDKVVKREICQKISPGTRTFTEAEGDDFLVSVSDDKKTSPKVGVCILNSSLFKLYVGEFNDDAQLTKLHTLLTLVGKAEILYSKSSTSLSVQKLLQNLQSTRKTCLKMPDVQKTLDDIKNKGYFDEDKENSSTNPLPEPLRNIFEKVGQDSSTTAISFALVANYLSDALIDEKVFAFKEIHSLERLSTTLAGESKSMVLFGHTLRNLDILPTTMNPNYSLLNVIDNASTPFGKRLLKHWLCNPLAKIEAIIERQTALSKIHELGGAKLKDIKMRLKKLCDFERILAWIFSNCLANENHPEASAVMYGSESQARKSVGYLITAVNSFENAANLLKVIKKGLDESDSPLLQKILNEENIQKLESACDEFKSSFDFDKAAKENMIIPAKGVDRCYDEAKAQLARMQARAKEYLDEQSDFFGAPCKFFGQGSSAYQLEVPDSVKKRATSEYVISSQKKGFTRYTTDETVEIRNDIQEAEEEVRVSLVGVNRRLFLKFHQVKDLWMQMVNYIATFDCLMSLHDYSFGLDQDESVFPEFLEEEKPFVQVKNGKHPLMLTSNAPQKMVIPNDVYLDDRVFILTGPNMGGKSTVLRQTATLVILAQLGCKVPAEEMRLTIVDRLFSRMGANDNIMEGESTFFVELLETSNILKHATKKSLAIIDELGRGTSTHDGCAIASAVIDHFTRRPARVMFTSHYHQLTKKYVERKDVALFHMAMIEPTDDQPLTFLYKVVPGTCPKSHGFNAARCAGIPAAVVRNAEEVAQKMEEKYA